MLLADLVEDARQKGKDRPRGGLGSLFKPESKEKSEIEKLTKYGEEAERLYTEAGEDSTLNSDTRPARVASAVPIQQPAST